MAKNDPNQDYSDTSIVSDGDLMKLLKSCTEDVKIDAAGKMLIRYLLDYVFCKIVKSAEIIRARSESKSITPGNIEDALQIVFDGKQLPKIMENAESATEKVDTVIKQERQEREKKNPKKKKAGGKKSSKTKKIEEDDEDPEEDEEVEDEKPAKRGRKAKSSSRNA